MRLEFKLYEMKEGSRYFKRFMEYNKKNEFIVIGETIVHGEEHFKVHQLQEDGLRMVAGLTLDQLAMLVPKDHFKLKTDGIGYDVTEMDIPKEYLTIDLIENIQKLND